MAHSVDDGPILRKTKELCITILEQPEFQAMRQQVETFLADDAAKNQYRTVVDKGEVLHQKQQRGLPLPDQDLADYESHRQTLVNNPVAKGFLEAQQHMQQVQESISHYISKTFELGRLPTEEDFSSGCCGSGSGSGSGCGCQH